MNKKLSDSIINLIVPNENVKAVRNLRNDNLKSLDLSEKINYKLHDRTTWTALAVIGFYVYEKNYTGALTELFNVLSGAF